MNPTFACITNEWNYVFRLDCALHCGNDVKANGLLPHLSSHKVFFGFLWTCRLQIKVILEWRNPELSLRLRLFAQCELKLSPMKICWNNGTGEEQYKYGFMACSLFKLKVPAYMHIFYRIATRRTKRNMCKGTFGYFQSESSFAVIVKFRLICTTVRPIDRFSLTLRARAYFT